MTRESIPARIASCTAAKVLPVLGVHLGHLRIRHLLHQTQVRAAQFVFRRADNMQALPACLKSIVTHCRTSGT